MESDNNRSPRHRELQQDNNWEPDDPTTKYVNPKLERFRATIKNSLFKEENSLSLQLSQAQGNFSDVISMDKEINTLDDAPAQLSEANEHKDTTKEDALSLSCKSPAISRTDDRSQFMSNRTITIDEHSKYEGGASQLSYSSPATYFKRADRDIRSYLDLSEFGEGKATPTLALLQYPIFMDTTQNEMEELKNEFKITKDSKIYFIQGNFFNYYKEGKILGEGQSGVVKKCIKISTNENYAVKIIRYRADKELLTLILNEFENLKKLDHQNIIKVYELYVDYYTKKVYSVMELTECREMLDVLSELGHYSVEETASGIMKQLLIGLRYLHANGVCHRDIKPGNILVSKDGKVVKIADFNVAKFFAKDSETTDKYTSLSKENYKMWTSTGTMAFKAPEMLFDSEYTENIDMWGAGIVLYTMLCGYQPFQSNNVQGLIEMIKEGQYKFHSEQWNGISEEAKDLIKRCLDVNYKTRYSPADALMHPWIVNQGKPLHIPKTPTKDKNLRSYYRNFIKQDKELNKSNSQTKRIQVKSINIAVTSPIADNFKKSRSINVLDDHLRERLQSLGSS